MRQFNHFEYRLQSRLVLYFVLKSGLFRFVGLGRAGYVGIKLGLTQLVNTEGGFKGLSFP